MPTFFLNNRAFYIFAKIFLFQRLFLKYFKNNFKIFEKYFFNRNSSVYFENIVVCNEHFKRDRIITFQIII